MTQIRQSQRRFRFAIDRDFPLTASVSIPGKDLNLRATDQAGSRWNLLSVSLLGKLSVLLPFLFARRSLGFGIYLFKKSEHIRVEFPGLVGKLHREIVILARAP